MVQLFWKTVWQLLKNVNLKLRVLVPQACPTLCGPVDCGSPDSSVYGILQARILEWVALPFSRGCPQPRNQIRVSRIVGRFFTVQATKEAPWMVQMQTEWRGQKGLH